MKCLLCHGDSLIEWYQDKFRPYFQCQKCSLIFVPRDFLLPPEEEKIRYDTHENTENDPRYRNYLTKIADGVVPFLNSGAHGLDFGCGASTLLATIFLEKCFSMDSYDLYYHPREEVWKGSYDFIVLSEVIEHLGDLTGTMESLKSLLKPNGQLFIKTKFYPLEQDSFSSWYYKNDLTHVQFFGLDSMARLASLLNMKGPQTLDSTDLYRLWT